MQNKLTKKQYEDEVSWSTRTWHALMAQRMSVALHLAAAWEIAVELKVPGAEDEAALVGAAASDAETRTAPCELAPVRRLRALACDCV